MQRIARLRFVGWWLVVGLLAAGISSLYWPRAHFADEYLPVGNDSFYHARRILDTVADPAAFYEFDPKIHAPEGSLLTWPWGYDYALAWLTKGLLALGVADSPMAILIWIPVAAVFVSMGLLMLIGRRLELNEGLVVIAGLAAAFSPMTQALHGVGQIDHHYAEYIFVLASIACGLRYLARPQDTKAAVVLGVVLGAAPAIHNGMFILQLPLLATLLVLWLQDIRVPVRTAGSFAASFLAATVAILIPSLPFRLGLFEYYTLSWFHLYVAGATAVMALAMAWLPRNRRSVALRVGAGWLLLLPLARQVLLVEGFFGRSIPRLDAIQEMQPVAPMVLTPMGRQSLSQSYSLLIWLLPLTAVYCAWQGWRERATARVFFWIWCLFGLALLLTQLRLHYFGTFVLYLPLLTVVQWGLQRWPQRQRPIVLGVSLAFLLAYWMPARATLTAVGEPAGDGTFRVLRPILEDLRKACAQDPGIVLADNDAGHYIRYYTDCSVVANNFLLTPQHAQKIRQMDYLTSLPANAFPGAAPFVRYILLRPVTINRDKTGSRITYMSFSTSTAPLVSDLLLKPVADVPGNYVLIEQANIHDHTKNEFIPYIRLYKVNPVSAPHADASMADASLKPVVH
jgi:hypothetical protein